MSKSPLRGTILPTLFCLIASCLPPQAHALPGGSIGYAIDASAFPVINLVSFPIPGGTPITNIGTTTANGQGADFGSGGTFYAIQNGSLVTVNLTSGATSSIGSITGVAGGQTIVGMGYQSSGNTMYLATTNTTTTSQLYGLNLTTAVATLIGTVTNAPVLIAIAVSCSGTIYGFEVTTDNLVRINSANAAGTVIGPLNLNAGLFSQDADFDAATGILYWATFSGGTSQLRSVDTSSGNSTLITALAADIGSFAIDAACPSTDVGQSSTEIPVSHLLSHNYPNPFNPGTRIKFHITGPAFVSLKVYDVLGREVAQLVHERLDAGSYDVDWSSGDAASGVYFYKLIASSPTSGGIEFTETKKMVLMR